MSSVGDPVPTQTSGIRSAGPARDDSPAARPSIEVGQQIGTPSRRSRTRSVY
jgi:hypothetical protein